ncbi:MAG TPA: polysaccharide pyruvyl transferase family protein [Candidatus Sulfotelmatobacter sp.]|jgi:succinoglycan biosynthesis protein ExoV|nr:polysaccharide pyruvyl transferase family protein [Candidatus Sulfotelmatobacter sp.]
MKLLYYKNAVPNFGDDLNADLWPHLAPDLFAEDGDEGFLGIGTIIGMTVPPLRRVHVFGSGAGYVRLKDWPVPADFVCVRGPLTAKLVGVEPDRALTDGAILSPFVPGLPQKNTTSDRIAVIPHWETMRCGGWEEACRLAGYQIIDPCRSPAQVLADIASAGLVLTESLHGAILADCYGVDWVPFASTSNFSIFKWKDWTLSVDAELEVASVPPPAAAAVMKFGRCAGRPWGTTTRYSEDDAQRELEERLAFADAAKAPAQAQSVSAKSLLRSASKAVLRHVPASQKLLGFTPQRTAEALRRLARQKSFLSQESHREALRGRMLERLGQLRGRTS